MPRLIHYRTKLQHDFAWCVELEAGRGIDLFTVPCNMPPAPVLAWTHAGDRFMTATPSKYISFSCASTTGSCGTVVGDVSVDHPDAVLELQLDTKTYTFSGPWMDCNALAVHELIKIYDDARTEGRLPAAVDVLREALEKAGSRGIWRPLILAMRQPMRATVRLLPGCLPALVRVHVRCLFSVSVDVDSPRVQTSPST